MDRPAVTSRFGSVVQHTLGHLKKLGVALQEVANQRRAGDLQMGPRVLTQAPPCVDGIRQIARSVAFNGLRNQRRERLGRNHQIAQTLARGLRDIAL